MIQRRRAAAPPVTPKAAHGIFDQLNWKMEFRGEEERFALADAEWGKLPDGGIQHRCFHALN